jgi:2-amino-4-hydroxy-6-hydroxymethyldihydropteridine diphosphokinase
LPARAGIARNKIAAAVDGRFSAAVFSSLQILAEPRNASSSVAVAVCLIGLGSNLGDRAHSLHRALASLRSHPRLNVAAVSTFHETQAVGGPGKQAAFLNAAATIITDLPPTDLLAILLETEQKLGRAPAQRWSARIIDLDLLLYSDQIISTPTLTVPHPRLAIRRFVLEPAVEIAQDMRHPQFGWTLGQLLRHLHTAANYVAITGPILEEPSRLTETVSQGIATHRIQTRAFRERLFAAHTDSAGLGLKTQLEFLDKCVAKLAEAMQRGSEWLVTDFWLCELLVHARMLLGRADRRRYEEVWQAQSREGVPPKLIVYLDRPAEDVQRTKSHLAGGYSMRPPQFAKELQREVMKPGRGPYLALDVADLDRACIEVEAAVQAMGESHG